VANLTGVAYIYASDGFNNWSVVLQQ